MIGRLRNAGHGRGSRWRIAGGFLLLGVGAVVLLAYATTTISGDALTQEVNQRLVAVSEHGALALDENADSDAVALDAYAHHHAIEHAADDAATATAELVAVRLSLPDLSGLAVMDTRGQVLAGSGDASFAGSGRAQSWFATARSSGNAFGDPSPGDGHLVIAVSVPLADGSIGVLAAHKDLSSVDGAMSVFAAQQSFTLAVYDRSGNLVDATAAVSKPPDAVSKALAGQSGTLSDQDSAGTELRGYAPVGTLHWAVVATVPAARAYVSVTDLRWSVVAIVAALVIFFAIGASLLNRALRRQQLAEAALRAAAEEAEHRSLHDPLTGLPNRALFHDRLDKALDYAARNERRLAVMFMDMNRFKEVNDTMGHQAGDLLLQQIADRLVGSLRATDTVARLGGDEFACVAVDVDGLAASHVASKMAMALGLPFALEEHLFQSDAAIGIACYPEDGKDADALMKAADTAMYQAKRRMASIRR